MILHTYTAKPLYIYILLTNCLRTAGGVAAVLTGCLCTPVLLAFFEPKLRGKVWDLLITAKFPGRFELTVNFRPDATRKSGANMKYEL